MKDESSDKLQIQTRRTPTREAQACKLKLKLKREAIWRATKGPGYSEMRASCSRRVEKISTLRGNELGAQSSRIRI